MAAVGVAGWKVWDNQKDKSSKNSTSTSQSDTVDATTSSAKQLEISQWGVKFEIPSSIPDLKVTTFTDYPAEDSNVASAVAILDSPTLEAKGKIKTTGTQERHEKLGQILRQKSGTEYYPGTTIEEYADTNNFASVKIGDYNYVYVTTFASDNADTYLNAIKSSIQSSLVSTD